MSLLPVLLLAVAALALGAAVLAAAGDPGVGSGARHRFGFAAAVDLAARSAVAGLVLLFVLLLALDAAGVPWRRRSLAAGGAVLFVALAAVAWYRQRGTSRRDAPAPPTPTAAPFGWGDGVALAAVATFAWACWQRLVAIPDFVYHWGLKGKRYALAGGVDVAFLADPLRLTDHPDYPNLLPSLYAATSHLRGFFDERSMLLWSPVFLLLLVGGARTALARGAAGDGAARRRVFAWSWLQAGTAAAALLAAMFAIGYDLAGGADLVIAAAVVVALPALLGADPDRTAASRRSDDLTVGMAAALAAGAKIEGVPLALLLLVLRLVADGGAAPAGAVAGWPARAVSTLRRLPRLAGPPALVVAPWLVTCLRHGLFRETNGGDFQLAHFGTVAGAALEVFNLPEWHGLPWLLVLLPPLLLSRRLRPAAALLLVQGGFYLYVYLAAPVDTEFYVLSSLPRLLYHLLPAHLVLLTLAAARHPRT
jgi:hypothetical protein